MRILIADDDENTRTILKSILTKWGHEVTIAENGEIALDVLTSTNSPRLAILDWMTPEYTGLEVCKLVRAEASASGHYLILLTARSDKKDLIAGLAAGADDFITKPFDHNELQARINVGRRVVDLQHALAERVQQLESAVEHIKSLQGVLPICMYCHKIRDDKNAWQQLEMYVHKHTDASFSHGVCPECALEHYPEDAVTTLSLLDESSEDR